MQNIWKVSWRASWWAACLGLLCASQVLSAPNDWANLSSEEAVPGEMVIVYRDAAITGSAAQRIGLKRRWAEARTPAAAGILHGRFGAQIKKRFSIAAAEVVRLPEGADLAAAAAAYAGSPDVAGVYPNRIYRASAYEPNDPLWDELWGLRMVGVDQAWETYPVDNMATVVVAVIDSGIKMDHPDLKDIIWINPGESANGNDDDGNGFVDDLHGWDFIENDNDPSDGNGHGTHVAGTIAAIRDNLEGVAGFSPAIRILPVRGLDAGGYGTTESLAGALEYVALMHAHVKISNNSWGGFGQDALISEMIDKARDVGQLVVVAAGNDTTDIDQTFVHPASMPQDNIITVASVNELDQISDFSNYGVVNVDIAAPGGTLSLSGGRQIWSTWHVHIDPDGLYNGISGTSMAAPHVAGAAAYLWALSPNSSYQEIKRALLDGAVVNPALAGYVAESRRLDLMGAIGEILGFAPFAPDVFYGNPAQGFPLSSGGVPANQAVSSLTNPKDEDSFIDIVIDSPEGVWLEVVTAPSYLSAGETQPFIVEIDESAPGFPTVPGLYSNIVSVTFTPDTEDPYTLTRTVYLRLSSTYFLQSAPFDWLDAASTNLTRGQLTGGGLPIPTNVTFTFYDHIYSSVYARADGLVMLEPPAPWPSRRNSSLPDAQSRRAALFPHWMPSALGAGSVSWATASVDGTPVFVITWRGVVANDDPSAVFDHQVILFDAAPGENSEIRYQYRAVAQDSPVYGMGRAATVGLQSDGGFLAAQYTVNGQWQPAPGMEFDERFQDGSLVAGLPMELADGQAIRWTWAARAPDSAPPTATIAPYILDADEIAFEVRFNEIVFDLDLADLDLQTTVPGLSLGSLTGGGERFLVSIAGTDGQYGQVSLSLTDQSVYDMAGNWNLGGAGGQVFAIPYRSTHIFDDFERGVGSWKASAYGNTSDFTSGGWEYGTPFPGVANGPQTAYSGTNCWGTFLGGDDWESANGYPNGWFPGGTAFAMQAQLDSPRVHVGAKAAISFQAFWSLGVASASVLAVPSAGADPVPLGTIAGNSGGDWIALRFTLPESLAHREIKIRLVVTAPYGSSGAGLYIDDFAVYSQQPAGVYFTGFTPETRSVPSAGLIGVIAYNTHDAPAEHVEGVFAAPVAGVSLAAGQRVAFGAIPVGGLVTAQVDCAVADRDYAARRIAVQGNSYIRGEFDAASQPPLYLDTVTLPFDLTLQAVTGSGGVRDWLGRPLRGDGSDSSALYQIIWVGADGVPNPPRADGGPGGDDIVLHGAGSGAPCERFGAASVAPHSGLFQRRFTHNLPIGSLLYARAWDGVTIDQSVAYGDSQLRALVSATDGEIVDFGTWIVGTPVQYNRDSNGDGIPDGYAVSHPELGIDPRALPDSEAPALRILDVAFCTKPGYRPLRVELFGDFVYILHISDAGLNGAIEVRDLSLSNLIQTVTTGQNAANPLRQVSGLALDRLNRKLYVSENSTERYLYRYAIGGDGLLAYETRVQNTFRPTDISVADDGAVYVAENKATVRRYDPLLVGASTQVLSYSPPTTTRATVFGDNIYRTFLDSTYQVHQVQRLSLSDGAQTGVFGQPQTGLMHKEVGYLFGPAKVWQGVGGLLYVADRSFHRIQVFDSSGGYLGVLPVDATAGGSASSVLGRFDNPVAIAVTNDPSGSHIIYVADESNHRVQRFGVILDSDGDGMDDAWEMLHGLDPTDPSDALLDNDGDSLSNRGEYLTGRDPNDPNSNDDSASDSFDLYEHPEVPAESVPARIVDLSAIVDDEAETVTITVTYDKAEPLNAPVRLSLSGGTYLSPTTIIVSGDTATYIYAIQPGDEGWVHVRVEGSFQDPPVYNSPDAFEIVTSAAQAELTALTASPVYVQSGDSVSIGATFSQPVTDATLIIATADGTVLLTSPMTPAVAAPAASWNFSYSTVPAPPNTWCVVTVTSTQLSGATAPRASFAVLDMRFTAIIAPPPPELSWNALTGVPYRVVSRDSLVTGDWETSLITNRVGLPALDTITVTPDDAGPHQFYRIVVP